MYQDGLVRVTPKADATGNRVSIAVTEAAVIPNPEEICPEMRPRILGPALLTANSCAFVGNAPEYSRVSFALDHTIADRCRVEETDKAPESSDTLPLRESLCLVLLGRIFTTGSTSPVAVQRGRVIPLPSGSNGTCLRQRNIMKPQGLTEVVGIILSVGLVMR